jgi:hypothetical protein
LQKAIGVCNEASINIVTILQLAFAIGWYYIVLTSFAVRTYRFDGIKHDAT